MTGRACTRAAARVVALFLLCAAAVARGGLFDDDEARKRVAELQTHVEQMQASISAFETTLKSQGLIDMLAQVEALKADLAKLRGQVEVLNNDVESAQKRQRDLYVDLDTRLRKLEGGPGAAAAPDAAPLVPGSVAAPSPLPTVVVPGAGSASPAAAPVAPRSAADAMTEQQSYDAAFDQFKAGNYAGAIDAFQVFVKTYPKSPLAPSAQYWIGNAQYAQREFTAAIATQRQLIRNYPDSQKVPDALLNIATNQMELSDVTGARKTLDEIMTKYPQSDAAEKARKRLGGAHQ